MTLNNSLVTATTNLLAGTGTLTTNAVTILSSNAGIYQTVGAGTHYLANGSPYRGAGTNAIDSGVLASLAFRTTYPPLIYSNLTFTVSSNLLLQAKRDTNVSPDEGYHYDPLDYITDNVTVTNSTLTITNGIAIACYNEPGITLQGGATIVSTGTPLLPNWLVRYQSVQDASVFLGGTNFSSGQNVVAASLVANRPNASFQFTHFATPANGGFIFKHTGNSAFNTLAVRHSELWGGTNDFSGPTNAATVSLFNSLFYRSGITAAGSSATATLAFTNDSIYGTALSLIEPTAGNWYFFNNDVDSSTVAAGSVITNGYNAFINCSTSLTGTANYISTNAIGYQTGPLGTFYQPVGSPLIDLGTGTGAGLTLGHFTTLTNQTIESNSLVDIGLHYVALGTNGLPLADTNGIPFYIEDAGGSGGGTNLPPIITVQPANYTAILSNSASFSVTATGTAPLKYQWRFNTTNILSGATNSSLTLNNVQLTNAGNFTVVVTNNFGLVTSSVAMLTVLLPVKITAQPTSLVTIQGSNATFNVTATGTAPLAYQWYFNATNLLSGAVTNSLTLTNVQSVNAGNYSVVVTNSAGSATSSAAILTVLTPPTVTITNPVNNATFTSGTNISIAASAASTSGTVTQVQFFQGTNSLGIDATAPYVWTWTNVPAGTYVLTAVATDNSGLITTSSNVTITVNTNMGNLPAGILFWWKAETNTLDSIGANNGTLQGGAGYTNGEVGQAFSFNGVDGFMSTAQQVNNPQNFSIECWFKTTTTSGGGLVECSDSQTGVPDEYDRVIYMDNAGHVHFGIYNSAFFLLDSTGTYNDGNWHHVAATVSTNSGSVLYLDGVSVTNNAAATVAQSYAGWWRVGQAELDSWPSLPTSYYFNGFIDEMSIYGRPLSSNEVAAIYSAGSAGKGLSLAPTITQQPGNYTAVLSNSASFTVTASGAATLKYQWRFNTNTVVPGATNVTLNLSNVQTTNAGNYTVIITNSYGGVTSSIATLTVVTKPVITAQPANYVANIGSTAMFGATATGVAPLKYQWWFNTNTIVSGATNATLTLTNVQAVNAGSYSVIVTNKYGAVTSSFAILTVLLPPAVAIASPVNGQVFSAYPTNIMLTAAASDPVGTVTGVVYYSGTTNLSGNLTVSPYAFTWTGVSIGAYQLTAVATDNSGLSTTSSAVDVIVDTLPMAAITSPISGLVIGGSTNLPVSASASDADGSITQLQIFAGPILLGTSASSPYSLIWSNVPSGSWNLTAVAFDNYGVGTTSSVVSLTVNNNTNSLPAIADTFVRDGMYTNINFGTNTTIEVKDNSGAPTNGLNRIAHFKFSLGGLTPNIGSAKLVVFSSLNTTGLVTNAVFSVTNTGWNETTLCWSNKPALVTALSSNVLNGTNGSWYQYEVTSYVKSQVAAGQPLVGLGLWVPNLNGLVITINSRENTSNNPYLYVVLTNPPPTVSFISPTNNAVLTVYSNLVSVAASGSNGIQQVNFYQGTNLFATDFTSPYNAYWNNSATGTFTLKAVAIDNAGLSATSSISVTVPIVDSDGDGLPDWFETSVSMTDPNNFDTDGNGISDANEYVDATGLTWLQYYQLTNNPQTVATPVVTSLGYAARAITLTCATPGATIYFTTNGLNPTTSSPYLYSGQAFWISSPETVKAMAGKAGMLSSATKTNICMVGKVVEGFGNVHVLKNDGTVWGWGNASYAAIGNGSNGCTVGPQLTPVQVVTGIGTNLTNVIDIASGFFHSLALKSDGTVWFWGNYNTFAGSPCNYSTNQAVQAMISTGTNIVKVACGAKHCAVLAADGRVWVWRNGAAPAKIKLSSGLDLTNVISISAGEQYVSGGGQGSDYTLALKSDGTIWSSIFGSAATLLTHSPQTDAASIDIETFFDSTTVVRQDATGYLFQNGNGTAISYLFDTNVLTASNLLSFVTGSDNAASQDFAFWLWQTGDGSLWTLGSDNYAQLGIGTQITSPSSAQYRHISPTDGYFNGVQVAWINAAFRNCIVVTADGSIWMWGGNDTGQLGNGSTNSVGVRTPTLAGLNLLANIVQNTNDSTGDGIPDWQKLLLGFSTNSAYSNGDGLWDTISMAAGINPFSTDIDGEGLSNTNEAIIGTDPFLPDTDGDGVNDLLDPFPLDPTRSSLPALSPTVPAITVVVPINAVPY